MVQKDIREYDGVEYKIDEGAELIKELDDRTKSSDVQFNSIQLIGEKLKAIIEKVNANQIEIAGSIFDYRPIKGNDGSTRQLGDVALNGWTGQNTFGKVLIYKGAAGGLGENLTDWDIKEKIG
jgi:hypothetical protein